MDPIETLCKLNLFNSSSLSDVRHYMTPPHLRGYDSRISELSYNSVKEYQFYGLDEEKNADKFEKFSYILNYYGFREETVSDLVDGGAFGCSFTFGQGLPNHALYHQIIARTKNKRVMNFGVPGASIQSIIDIFCIVTKHIKMNYAFILLPSYNRFQIAKQTHPDKLNFLSCIPSHKGIFNNLCGVFEPEFYKITPDEEFIKDTKNSLYLAEHLAKLRNIKLSISSWDRQTYNILNNMNFSSGIHILPEWTTPPELESDKARDNRHPGYEHHKVHALKFMSFMD